MNLRDVAKDIENQNNRTLAAIERWLAADETRIMTVAFDTSVGGRGGWQVRLSVRVDCDSLREWHKPTMVDALAHAASYCQVEAP